MSRDQKNALHCAIYTRKSSEEGLEQSFNSLDAQREASEAFIASQRHEGWRATPTRYDDIARLGVCKSGFGRIGKKVSVRSTFRTQSVHPGALREISERLQLAAASVGSAVCGRTAFNMPEAVIHLFESVQIQHQDGQRTIRIICERWQSFFSY